MSKQGGVKPLRLERWLSQLGYVASRREAGWFLRDHRVEINGEPVERGDVKVLPDHVTIDGEKMDPAQVVVMLNKPAGYVCSHEDAGLRVYDLLPERFQMRRPQLVTVGRLDKDTTGLLLMTDDGNLVHRLTHPKHHIPKTYEVELADALRGNEAELFASGTLMLDSEEKPLLPGELEVLGERKARLTLHEGRYHQVKRMFGAVGNAVTTLHRASLGKLTLDGLPEGEWRVLTEDDLARLS